MACWISINTSTNTPSQLRPFLFICARLRFVRVSLTLVDLPPCYSAAAAEEERCGDEGFDY